MNQVIVTARKILGRFSALIVMLLSSAVLFAQDTKQVDVNINTKGDSSFFSNPIVWVIGGAVFVLLLVALLRNNSKSTT
jgi:hypothetical protein